IPRPTMEPAAHWIVQKTIRLLNAAANLCFGEFDRIELAVGDRRLSNEDEKAPSVSDVFRLARERELVRKAFLSFHAAGPEGLFEAYEAISSELMRCGVTDYSRNIGTKEWIVQEGWADGEEIERFLDTVLHFRNEQDGAPSNSISPREAEGLVRRLLW